MIFPFTHAAKAVGNGPVGQVLAGPLFLKIKNKISIYQKPSNKQKYYDDFWACSACYNSVYQKEKAYDEVENY